MPQLGETIIEGTILKWLKREGEMVQADEPLFEISTDKVDTEVPSPVTGVVTKILVAEGETVAVGTRLAEIDSGGPAWAGRRSRVRLCPHPCPPAARNRASGTSRTGAAVADPVAARSQAR
jgi:2-oxoglutarate dehydrogenase E2 component (dihydrolipoamide succinyltransferase)